ncbi:glycosyltransferase family 4 protein [Pedosphaera parvula]|uniref:Glycosyl transferase group 1 n=1 Tax=Pedosphaera parvula (strain Ellin514) TaxID=320771 RepID=B9XKN8_PEDPL|nr:glycosyltransferase family 4 protein [Pedosphaera parvula]EEF59531.1 glycosyl transferase group 1 [Pedosphaera parvula Ellin514]
MARRKNIALCLEYQLALRGGVSVLVENLLAGLAPHYDLVLVSRDSAKEFATSPMASLVQQHFHWELTAASPMTARELAGIGVDLAHFHLGGNYGFGNRYIGHCPIPLLNKKGIPCCSTVHSVIDPLNGFCGPEKPLWFKLALLPIAWAGKMHSLLHTKKEIAVSQHDLAKLQRWHFPLKGRYLQIYHSRLKQAPLATNELARESIILNVGHIAFPKGQVVLAEAFTQIAAKYPDWKLCLIGHVAEKEAAARVRETAKAHKLEDRIQLVGERHDVMDWMTRAGIYVQPSFFEALGLALQEAMFRGCPAIGSRVGGIPELIDHQKTGLLVEHNNAAELARALESLIANSALREQYGKAGAVSIRERGMTFEDMVANHIRLYESILQNA